MRFMNCIFNLFSDMIMDVASMSIMSMEIVEVKDKI